MHTNTSTRVGQRAACFAAARLMPAQVTLMYRMKRQTVFIIPHNLSDVESDIEDIYSERKGGRLRLHTEFINDINDLQQGDH